MAKLQNNSDIGEIKRTDFGFFGCEESQESHWRDYIHTSKYFINGVFVDYGCYSGTSGLYPNKHDKDYKHDLYTGLLPHHTIRYEADKRVIRTAK